MSFTHILVPTDFSPMANHALRYALDEARLHQAHLTLLHVLTQRTGTEVYYLSGTPSMQVRLDPRLGIASQPCSRRTPACSCTTTMPKPCSSYGS